MPAIAILNGRAMPLSRARLSTEDRGCLFGDGVYEVVRVYGGVPYLLDAHLKRFVRSAAAIRLPLGGPSQRWARWSRLAVARSGYREAKLYWQATRGAAPREHLFPRRVCPTTLVTIRPLTTLPGLRRGVRVITLPDLRWGRCDIKSLNLLPNILAKQTAKERGAFEAVLVRAGVGATEGASTNIFVVTRRGEVVTPPVGPTILSGVTRARVILLARREGIRVKEAPISVKQLAAARELFLSGTLTEVLPVARCNGRLINGGQIGLVTQRLAEAFHRDVSRLTARGLGQRR